MSLGYEYMPLNADRHQIRVVTLHPGSWEDDVLCSLSIVPFDGDTRYEALSYVWGDPSITHRILLDDWPADVTENLWLALRRLRDPLATRTIWIDALCINQRDDKEKSSQVAMMGEIYENCEEVILRLGEDPTVPPHDLPSTSPPTSIMARRAFELLRLFASDQHLHELPCFVTDDISEMRSTAEFRLHFEATAHMFNLLWWRHIWIVQELALPDRATFVYASETCSYDTLEACVRLFAIHCDSCCKDFYSRYRSTDPLTTDVIDPLNGTLHSLISIRNNTKNETRFSLAELRMILCTSYATDQRDLFYALLGLMTTTTSQPAEGFELEPQPLLPDYSLSARSAIARVVVKCITQSGSLAIITGLRCPWMKTAKTMSTWLPQSSIDALPSAWAGFTERRLRRALSFDASPSQPPDVTLLDNEDTTLVVKGLKVDTVKLVGPMYEGTGTLHAVVREWADMAGLLLRDEGVVSGAGGSSTSWPTTPPPDGSLEDAFWKTILCNRLELSQSDGRRPLYRSPDDNDYPQMRAWLMEVMAVTSTTATAAVDDESISPPPPPSPIPQFWSYLSADQSLGYRKMFLTESGRVGLAPHLVMPGDEVHVLLGASVPFVLRPRSGNEARTSCDVSEARSYTVIGDGYLHGIMEGEALQGEALTRCKHIELM